MTQEEKQLLLADLCARLPYNVKVQTPVMNDEITLTCGDISAYFFNPDNELFLKPYLRPMSSMTEEELEELKTLCSIYRPTNHPTIGFEDYGILVFTHHLTNNTYSFKLNIDIVDWLNAHHFDYRGLIEKGLALLAPDDMYN